MLQKFSPAGAIIILFLLTVLISCKDNIRNGGSGNNGGITFDTARASKYIIPITEAITLQKNFITTRIEVSRKVTDTFLTGNFNLPNSESFTKDALLLLLNQKGADGIRFYYGKDKKGVVRLVMLPVTKEGKDIYTKLIASSTTKLNTDSSAPRVNTRDATAENNAEAVETGQTCPPCLIDPRQQ